MGKVKVLYDSILSRSFSKNEQKKLGYGALVGCLFFTFTFCTVLRPYLGPLPVLNLQRSTSVGLKMLMVKDTSISQAQQHFSVTVKDTITSQTLNMLMVNHTSNSHSQQILEVEEIVKRREPVCNMMERTDFCDIDNDVRIVRQTSSVFMDILEGNTNTSWSLRPYARKTDAMAMRQVTEWTVKSTATRSEMPECTQYHSVPAVLFSIGGYTGNHFHDFTDVIIPLFITSRKFNGEVKLLVTDKRSWWIPKFKWILRKLSNYDPIDIDKEKDVHCFPSAIIGLKRHKKELSIDPAKHSYSMTDFKEFLRASYSLKRAKAIKIKDGQKKKKPQLLIVSRKRTRAFTNINEISKMGRRLGYKVNVAELDMNLTRVAEIVNSCDVMMGVHGAGLTNIVFLPENAIFIQIVPYGGVEWVSTNFFGDPSKDMKLKYLEYKIRIEESTLIKQYPVDDVVLRDPSVIQKQGWEAFRSTYLVKQNVNLDVKRFKPTLLKALELLHQ